MTIHRSPVRTTPLRPRLALLGFLLASISHAGPVQDIIDATPNGGTALIPAGTYPERLFVTRRTDLTIKGEGQVEITGGMAIDEGSRYLIEDLRFTGKGISVYGADVRPIQGITFRRVRVLDVPSPLESLSGTGINFAFAHDIVVEDCEIARTGYHAIRIVSESERVTIRRNWLHDGRGDGIAGGPVSGDFLIEHNVIHDFTDSQAHGDGVQAMSWGRLIIRFNEVWSCTQSIFVERSTTPLPADPSIIAGPVYIYGNVVRNPLWVADEDGKRGWFNGIVFRLWTSIEAAYVFNNTLIDLNAGSGALRFLSDHDDNRIGVGVIVNNIVRDSNWIVPPQWFENLGSETNAFSNFLPDRAVDEWIAASPGSRLVTGGLNSRNRPIDDRFDFGQEVILDLDWHDLDADGTSRRPAPWTVGAFVAPTEAPSPTPSPTATPTPTPEPTASPTATPTATPTPEPTPAPDVFLGVLIGDDGHRYRIMRSPDGNIYGVRMQP